MYDKVLFVMSTRFGAQLSEGVDMSTSKSRKAKRIRRYERTTKRILLTCFIVIAVFLALILGPLSGILNKNEPIQIVIGHSKYDYPPLHYIVNDELVGFDIELAQAVAEIINAEIEFVPIDWGKKAEMLESGEVDLLWGGLELASLDGKRVAFSSPYLHSAIVLLMLEDRDYEEFADLQGLNVCALNFTAAFDYFNVYNRDVIKSKRSFTPPEYQSLLESLSSGDFDCLITDTSFASFFLRVNNNASYRMSSPLISSNYAVGVRIDDTELYELLQDALEQLRADGTIDRLTEKWIHS